MRVLVLLCSFLCSQWVFSGEVVIEHVTLHSQGNGKYRVDTRLKHADTGWKHYADAWRVVSKKDNKVLATRTLFHPHVEEQPFTRSVSVTIPAELQKVYVEAHDKVHGWNKTHVLIDMNKPKGKAYEIKK